MEPAISPIVVDERQADAKSRLAAIRLSMLTLRLMDNWRQYAGDYDGAMILLAISAIQTEKLTRVDLEPELESLSRPLPNDRMAICNLSSIAGATGLNRETVRRKVDKLAADGFVVRGERTISLRPGLSQEARASQLVRNQLECLVRTINDLMRDGLLHRSQGLSVGPSGSS